MAALLFALEVTQLNILIRNGDGFGSLISPQGGKLNSFQYEKMNCNEYVIKPVDIVNESENEKCFYPLYYLYKLHGYEFEFRENNREGNSCSRCWGFRYIYVQDVYTFVSRGKAGSQKNMIYE